MQSSSIGWGATP